MKYYSTNKQAPDATLEEAVVKGLAADKGLFMPFAIKPLPQDFYDSIDTLGFQEIAYRVADAFFGEDVPADTLKQIVYDTLSFDVPLVKVTENIYSLEVLSVGGHVKHGTYVSSHLHLNVTYLLEAEEHESLSIKLDENSNVSWFSPEEAIRASSEQWFKENIYNKLISKMKQK